MTAMAASCAVLTGALTNSASSASAITTKITRCRSTRRRIDSIISSALVGSVNSENTTISERRRNRAASVDSASVKLGCSAL